MSLNIEKIEEQIRIKSEKELQIKLNKLEEQKQYMELLLEYVEANVFIHREYVDRKIKDKSWNGDRKLVIVGSYEFITKEFILNKIEEIGIFNEYGTPNIRINGNGNLEIGQRFGSQSYINVKNLGDELNGKKQKAHEILNRINQDLKTLDNLHEELENNSKVYAEIYEKNDMEKVNVKCKELFDKMKKYNEGE